MILIGPDPECDWITLAPLPSHYVTQCRATRAGTDLDSLDDAASAGEEGGQNVTLSTYYTTKAKWKD